MIRVDARCAGNMLPGDEYSTSHRRIRDCPLAWPSAALNAEVLRSAVGIKVGQARRSADNLQEVVCGSEGIRNRNSRSEPERAHRDGSDFIRASQKDDLVAVAVSLRCGVVEEQTRVSRHAVYRK